MAPIKNMKIVDKAFELPLVMSAYTEIASIAKPLVESSLTTITPMVEVGFATIKTKVEESVMPHLPDGMSEKIQTNMSSAVNHVTAAVEKIDTIACGGIDQLVVKIQATPELIENSKETVSKNVTAATDYVASFSLAQVYLKTVDSGLDIVEGAIKLTGGTEEGTALSCVKKIHTTANTIRISGNKIAGTAKAKKIEEASIIGALLEVSGLSFLLGSLGLVGTVEERVEAVTDEADVTFDEDDIVEEVESECHTSVCDKTAHRTCVVPLWNQLPDQLKKVD